MRLIDADALAVFSYKGTEGYADCFDGGVLFTLERLDKAPTIDAEPVKHGHWIATSDPKENVFGAVRYLCSFCDDVVYLNPLKIDLEKYCRCCGAKMDEVMMNE